VSMSARFVQVAPDLLKQLLEDPSRAPRLFESPEPAGLAPARLEGPARARFVRRAPQMLAGVLDVLDPALRERLAKRLELSGIKVESLATGAGGDALLKRMAERARSKADAARATGRGKGAELSLDKAWHGVHYLLCGEVEPGPTTLSQAVLGGTEFGDDDFGYGPARYFEAGDVARIAGDLSGANLEAEMIARFDPARMTQMGIYPQGWQPAGREWLLATFRRLRDFYADAGVRQFALVTCIV
jgi:uncharacterized protein DUF1877